MSTRSAIIEKLDDGTYRGIYCHFDGYLEGVGHMLRDHYADSAKVGSLINLGDVSRLSEAVEPPEGKAHTFDRPLEGVTVSYMRDRGEEGCEPRVGASIAEVEMQIGHNGYVYVYDGSWTCNGAPIAANAEDDRATG